MPRTSGFTLWELLVYARRGRCRPWCRHSDLSLVSARWPPHGRCERLGPGRATRGGQPGLPNAAALSSCRRGPAIPWRCATGTAGTALAGWMVFVNLDDRYPPQRSPAEPLLYMYTPELEGTYPRQPALLRVPSRPAQHQEPPCFAMFGARRRRGQSS